MRQLGEAVNDSISDSAQVAEVIARVKASGYDIFVILEATIGFNKHIEEAPATNTGPTDRPELQISPQDARFLKSLRISLEPTAGRKR